MNRRYDYLPCMNYQRVIPRDLFNEASLLKCLGQLALLHLDRPVEGLELEHSEPAEGFLVLQDPASGAIFCPLIRVVNVRGTSVVLQRPLNSRQDWPLEIELEDRTIPVFTSFGSFHPDFLEWASTP